MPLLVVAVADRMRLRLWGDVCYNLLQEVPEVVEGGQAREVRFGERDHASSGGRGSEKMTGSGRDTFT